MIIWLNIAPGQGYHQLMKPSLKDKRSLYIGPRAMATFLRQDWADYDVTFTTPLRLLKKEQPEVDQILIQELGIRWHPEMQLRQGRGYHNVVEFLRERPDVPVLFRPKFGQWNHYPVLCADLMRPIQRSATEEIGNVTTECVQLKHRLGELGLFKTMQEMEKVVTAVGYEIAEKLTK